MQGSDGISTCRHCRFYQLEGRRGGYCQQLGTLMQGGWKACQLAVSPFATSWKLEEQVWKLEAVELPQCALSKRSTLGATGRLGSDDPDAEPLDAPLETVISISAIAHSRQPLATTA